MHTWVADCSPEEEFWICEDRAGSSENGQFHLGSKICLPPADACLATEERANGTVYCPGLTTVEVAGQMVQVQRNISDCWGDQGLSGYKFALPGTRVNVRCDVGSTNSALDPHSDNTRSSQQVCKNGGWVLLHSPPGVTPDEELATCIYDGTPEPSPEPIGVEPEPDGNQTSAKDEVEHALIKLMDGSCKLGPLPCWVVGALLGLLVILCAVFTRKIKKVRKNKTDSDFSTHLMFEEEPGGRDSNPARKTDTEKFNFDTEEDEAL